MSRRWLVSAHNAPMMRTCCAPNSYAMRCAQLARRNMPVADTLSAVLNLNRAPFHASEEPGGAPERCHWPWR